jgi:hypothetical protein
MKSTDDIPTRLIEIVGTIEWRLCDTAKEACTERVKFIALSYRWPKEPSILLSIKGGEEPIFRRG